MKKTEQFCEICTRIHCNKLLNLILKKNYVNEFTVVLYHLNGIIFPVIM
ncbi:hypothetical protein BH20BAC1_BH20BAC1_02210 [soil metagenome]